MPEKTRVVRRPEGEPNYHIFYQLLSGADDDLRRTLGLDRLTEPNLFMTPLQRVSLDKAHTRLCFTLKLGMFFVDFFVLVTV